MMEDSFKSLIEKVTSISILLPTKPYFDQVASGLALYLSLRGDKEVVVVSPTPITVEFNRLIGVNKITQELGNKNLLISLEGYDAGNVERVSADVKDGKFYLTVIPKPSLTPPKKEQVQLSYAGVASDTAILVGGANETHFPALSSNDLAGAKLVHIGTKDLSFTSGKSLISFAKPASSVSEVVASLIKESGLNIDGDVATNLLMGIEEGSNNFTGPDVNAETFQLVASLMQAGGQRHRRASQQRRDFPPGAIPGELPRKRPREQKVDEAPKDWLEPKVYKGTSIR